MSITLTQTEIPLAKLVVHPENVRAKTSDTEPESDIMGLATSIKAIGLINPLTVQKLDSGKWGVLAGKRRLAALGALVEAKAIKKSIKVSCNELPVDFNATTALSFAENDTVRQMSPIDEFDAFAKMIDEGMAPDAIALAIGQTEARVKERLRYSLVAPALREAARAKEITLDVMKAFANHPDHDVQIEVYEALSEAGQLQSWAIREKLRNRGVKVSDGIGQLVSETYQERGGEVAGDLIPEHSVLNDNALIEEILLEKLQEAAEAERAKHGFAWADAQRSLDWQEMQAFGRVYPQETELDEAAQKRLDAIVERLNAIEEEQQTEEIDDKTADALDDEWEALSEEATELQEAYTEEDLQRAGVMAHWQGSSVTITVGLVRPEDDETATDASSKATDAANSGELTYSASLESDLGVERAIALGAALCTDHGLADDLLKYKTITDVLGPVPRTYQLSVSASIAERPHAKPEGMDQSAIHAMEDFKSKLDLSFLEAGSPLACFEAFRDLKPAMKAKLVAYALAQTIRPGLASGRTGDVFKDLEAAIMPNIRDFWRPTGEAFFGRLKLDWLVSILKDDLGMSDEAVNLAGGRKAAAVEFMERLFAEPYATLTEDQFAAVAAWAPEGMQAHGSAADQNTAEEPEQAIAAE
ncbi:ParB/RepB/Spo0J family partition protein [uncultured Tateyamaria sp.]|uniref:ParB/RepB/Spo0J family partition protein n=1 Tax=uncultured Tateyamaria sp. TaxID=455651 RepID=UPI00261DBA53|nr:ParB/RepB/Spo0J family partition protein [uncultured Tateyamaria sp.]